VACILFASIAEASASAMLANSDYSITSKSTHASECDVALERYRTYMLVHNYLQKSKEQVHNILSINNRTEMRSGHSYHVGR